MRPDRITIVSLTQAGMTVIYRGTATGDMFNKTLIPSQQRVGSGLAAMQADKP